MKWLAFLVALASFGGWWHYHKQFLEYEEKMQKVCGWSAPGDYGCEAEYSKKHGLNPNFYGMICVFIGWVCLLYSMGINDVTKEQIDGRS